MATIGYMVRMLIYGYAFYICVKISLTAGIACLIGFFTLKVPMYYFHVVRYKLDKNRKVRPEVQRQFEEEDRLADNDDFDREEE